MWPSTAIQCRTLQTEDSVGPCSGLVIRWVYGLQVLSFVVHVSWADLWGHVRSVCWWVG